MKQIVVQKRIYIISLKTQSFNYKTSITGKLEHGNVEKDDVKIDVPLKYLSNFWRTLDIPLINSEVSLILTWSENCVITSKATKDADPDANLAVDEINNPTNATFKITDTKLYVLVVTLSAENDSKLLQQLKTGFKRTIKWNKYISEMSNQAKNNNLNYLTDPTFTKVNRLFVLSFKKDNDRDPYFNYSVPKFEIKDFNVLIDGKPFLEIPVRNKDETYEAIIEMTKNNDSTTGNILDYEYFSKLIAKDLSKHLIEPDNKSSKFATRIWYIINDKNNVQYGKAGENNSSIKFETKVIKSSLCDYSHAYILVTGNINAAGGNANTKVAFRNCAPFRIRVTHINDEHVETA